MGQDLERLEIGPIGLPLIQEESEEEMDDPEYEENPEWDWAVVFYILRLMFCLLLARCFDNNEEDALLSLSPFVLFVIHFCLF